MRIVEGTIIVIILKRDVGLRGLGLPQPGVGGGVAVGEATAGLDWSRAEGLRGLNLHRLGLQPRTLEDVIIVIQIDLRHTQVILVYVDINDRGNFYFIIILIVLEDR